MLTNATERLTYDGGQQRVLVHSGTSQALPFDGRRRNTEPGILPALVQTSLLNL